MEPEQLAAEVQDVMVRAMSRVGPGSIGAEQYHQPGQPQKFETLSMGSFKQMYLEELEDIITYAVMTHIRVRRLFEDLAKLEELLEGSTDNPDANVGDGSGHGLPFGAAAFTPVHDV